MPSLATTGGGQFESNLVVGETQLVADPRTNRILVVTRPVNLPYIKKLSAPARPLPAQAAPERPGFELDPDDPNPSLFAMAPDSNQADASALGGPLDAPDTQITASGLKITELSVGNGAEASSGQTVVVHYRGTLESGKQFDASYDRGTPFTFPLGAGRVIKGWDEGVVGMKVGGKRKLVIPPDLAYGSRGAGGVIPPNATLVFEVELLDVK